MGRVRDASRHRQRAANQADFEDSATFSRRLIKIVGNARPVARPDAFPGPVRLRGNGCRRIHHKCRNRARISRICLECAAIFGHLPLTIRCRLGDYTRAMMIRRILTICAAVAAGAAGTSLAQAPAELSGSPRRDLFALSAQRPAGRLSPRGAPDFDALDEEDEGPNAQSSTALPPPGPVLSPDDPRYGRPMGARRFIPTAAHRPARSCRPTIRAMAARWGRRRFIPTAVHRPVRSCRPMTRVMVVATDRRR